MVRLLLLGLCIAVLAGCSGSSPAIDGGSTIDAGLVGCEQDSRVQPYAPGVATASASGALHLALVQADPAPPARGTNTWTVKATDASGAAASGATFSVDAFMPDHGHGSSVTPLIVAQGGGSYQVSNLYFFMPGVWRVTFTPQADGGAAGDAAAFFFCVEG